MNEQLQQAKDCFDNLAASVKSLGDHVHATLVWKYFNDKIAAVKSAWVHLQSSRDASTADERFEVANLRCNDIWRAIHVLETDPSWNIRGIQYSAYLVHDWASICFSAYMAWITVHIVYPNSPDNASPQHIFGEGVRIFDQFELYYHKASEKIRQRDPSADAGVLRTFQKYTSNFASNLHLARSLAQEGKPYPPLPPRAKVEICLCNPNSLLQIPDDSKQNYTEHYALVEEDHGPWGRNVCIQTNSPSQTQRCPRRIDCRHKNMGGFETCRRVPANMRDICRNCRGTSCTDRVVYRHGNTVKQRMEAREKCFNSGGIYFRDW